MVALKALIPNCYTCYNLQLHMQNFKGTSGAYQVFRRSTIINKILMESRTLAAEQRTTAKQEM